MKILYGVIPTLVILSVILVSYPFDAYAEPAGVTGPPDPEENTPPPPPLKTRYAFDIYLVFDAVDLSDAIQVRDAFKTKSETYPLKDHFQSWDHSIENHNGRDLAQLYASFTFEEKDDCIAFYNWILTNMPQNIKDNILYGRILVTDNSHHHPNDDMKPDVIVFENTIGSLDDADFEY